MDIKLIIGLGNPGPKYANTYHNAGALFAEYFKDFINRQQWISSRLAILASELYVNESGKFVIKKLKETGDHPVNLLIAHDDSDIKIGKYKFTPPGHSAAGHHGVESVQNYIGSKFWRLRIGIRPKQSESERRLKAEEFVLKKISPADNELLKKAFGEAIEELKSKNNAPN